ncbi:MAG: capsular polysaccharide synthesis protein [Candidatus Theseobacter exili]|nr:capsular polysaccharide synthesis protein [Candidatus Theseobacter exili]
MKKNILEMAHELMYLARGFRPQVPITNDRLNEGTDIIKEKNNKTNLLDLVRNTKINPNEKRHNVIWIYWDTGFTNSPDIVKTSYFSWLKMNPDREVVFLHDENINQVLKFNFTELFSFFPSVKLGKAGMSDVLRLYILYRFGGVWVDATTYCLKPINEWLDISQTNFFCFRQPENVIDRQMVFWFVASNQGGEIIHNLMNKALDYLSKKRDICLSVHGLVNSDQTRNFISRELTGYEYLQWAELKGHIPYFWMFYLFNETCKNHSMAKVWEQVCKQPNSYVQPSHGFGSFNHSHVSKQTYRDGNDVTKSILEERKNFIIKKIIKNETVVSIHLPQTAGTSFRKILSSTYHDRVMFDYGDKIMDSSSKTNLFREERRKKKIDYLLELKHEELPKIIHGHFYAKKYISFRGIFKFTTIVREPLALVISLYNYLNDRPDSNPIVDKAKNMTFENFIEDEWFVNIMTTQLKGFEIDDFELIGLQEEFDLYKSRFMSLFGIKFENESIYENTSNTKKVELSSISDELKSKFYLLNAKDVDFYNSCKEKYGSKHLVF